MASPAVSSSRTKRETILSRSKRIIGKHLPNDMKEEDPADDSGSSTSAKNNVSKRRAQILKAQRTHRRRTQNYIQELEKEVLRLRAREAEMLAELESRSSSSRSQSQSYGLPSPSPSSEGGRSEAVKPNDTPTVMVDFTDFGHLEPEYPCTIQAALGPLFEFSPSSQDITTPMNEISINEAGTNSGVVCSMDAQAAIDFILDLERPCLPHVKYDMKTERPTPFKVPNFNFGMSHACTASAAIIQSHQHIDLSAQKLSMPVHDIERLLESTKSLPLGPEMTPVQVWAIIVDISSQKPIQKTTFDSLKEMLGRYMRCNAFGTTIQIDILRQVLDHFFPWYSTAQLHDNIPPVTQLGQERMDSYAGEGWQEFF